MVPHVRAVKFSPSVTTMNRKFPIALVLYRSCPPPSSVSVVMFQIRCQRNFLFFRVEASCFLIICRFRAIFLLQSRETQSLFDSKNGHESVTRIPLTKKGMTGMFFSRSSSIWILIDSLKKSRCQEIRPRAFVVCASYFRLLMTPVICNRHNGTCHHRCAKWRLPPVNLLISGVPPIQINGK